MKKFLATTITVAVASILVSCGGGGDESGDVGTMVVTPSDWTLKGPSDERYCGYLADVNQKFTIIGGQPPFRIHVSSPDDVYVDTTFIEKGQDPIFTMTYVRFCFGEATITVLDKDSQNAAVEITAEDAEEADTATE